VPFAELQERAKVCNQQATGNMPVDMFDHLLCLPSQQTLLSAVSMLLRRLRILLPPQQRECFEYRAVCRLFVTKLPDSRIEQRDQVVHPFLMTTDKSIGDQPGFRR
jgi:hypothetical protein